MLRSNYSLHMVSDTKFLGSYHIGSAVYSNNHGPDKNVIRFYFKPNININTTLKLRTSNNYHILNTLNTKGGLGTLANINIKLSGNENTYGCSVTLEELRGTLTFSAKIHFNKEKRHVILDILFDNWEYYWTGGSIIFETPSSHHIGDMTSVCSILNAIEKYEVIKVDDVSDYFSLLTDHTFEVNGHISQASETYNIYNNKNRMLSGPTMSISGVAGYYLSAKSIKIPNNTKLMCIFSPTYAHSMHESWAYIYEGNVGYWGPILESDIYIPIRIYDKNSKILYTQNDDMRLVYDGKDNFYHYYHFYDEGCCDNHWILNAYDYDYADHIFPEKKLHNFYLLNNIISSPLYKHNKGGVIIC